MIIACPACMTRYVVPDTSIGPEGRTVRCAKCRHSWFQDGPELVGAEAAREPAERQVEESDRSEPEPAAPSEGADAEGATGAPSNGYFRDGDPAKGAPPYPQTSPAAVSSTPKGSGLSRFDISPPFARRRNQLRLWTWVAAIFAALALGAIVAIYAWGLPNWVPVSRPTFAASQPELQLDFPLEQQERRQLPNGTEYFGASGTVTNTGSVSREVPPILIVLRDDQERIVYSWEVIPPRRTLAPGETMAINEAVTDVPRSARVAEIGWKPD